MTNETLYAQMSDMGGMLIAGLHIKLAENATMLNLIDKSRLYEAQLRGSRTLNIPYESSAATASVLTEGTDFTTNSQFSTASPSFTLRELGVQTIHSLNTTEDTKTGADGSLLAQMNMWKMNGMVTSIESDLCALLSGFTGNDASTAGSDLSEATWLAAITKLRLQNVSQTGERIVGVLHPQQWQDLATNMNDASVYGPAGQDIIDNFALRNARVGAPYGVETFTTNNIALSSSNYCGGLFIPSALLFCWKRRPESATFYDQGNRWTENTTTCRYLYGENVDLWGCKLNTDA